MATRVSLLVLSAALALAACQTTDAQSGAASTQTASAPGMSTGAKAIFDRMMADAGKMKQACQGGRTGVTSYTSTVMGQLMSEGNASIKPEADAPAAGQAAGGKCASIMMGG